MSTTTNEPTKLLAIHLPVNDNYGINGTLFHQSTSFRPIIIFQPADPEKMEGGYSIGIYAYTPQKAEFIQYLKEILDNQMKTWFGDNDPDYFEDFIIDNDIELIEAATNTFGASTFQEYIDKYIEYIDRVNEDNCYGESDYIERLKNIK